MHDTTRTPWIEAAAKLNRERELEIVTAGTSFSTTIVPVGEYIVGDVVRLRSGGPAMTVRTVTGPEVMCNWFAACPLDDGQVRSGMFPAAMLEPVAFPTTDN